MRRTWIAALLIAGVVAAGCVPPGSAGSSSPVSSSGSPGATAKRIVIGTGAEPNIGPLSRGQAMVIQPLVSAGLTAKDPSGALRPILAERVPTLENGLWTLLPGGRMETTWTLRDGAHWHDGTPLTADDLLFSLEVGRDPKQPAFAFVGYADIDEVNAPDARTLTITWKQPYIHADRLLGGVGLRTPLPRQRLEQAYREEKASLLDLPYWTQDYVGTGPYRLRQWTTGVGVRLEANREFVLGRPFVDEIELRIIPDANTLAANLLAGAVDVTPQVGSTDLGLQLRNKWRDGTVAFNLGSGNFQWMIPQFIDSHPPVVADVRFRRALVMAMDRQEMVDTLRAGTSPVPHSFLDLNQPESREIEATIPRYTYDPRQAAEQLQELGYVKGANGLYRDAAGRRLDVEVRTGPTEELEKTGAAIAEYWRRLGLTATVERVPSQRMEDFEYLATFPAFFVLGGPTGNPRLLHSSRVRLASNNFRAGGLSRYMNADLDALVDTHDRTVPMLERTQVLGQIAHHVADKVTIVGLNYSVTAGAISKRLQNVSTQWPGFQITWNAYEWDVR